MNNRDEIVLGFTTFTLVVSLFMYFTLSKSNYHYAIGEHLCLQPPNSFVFEATVLAQFKYKGKNGYVLNFTSPTEGVNLVPEDIADNFKVACK